MRDSVKLVILGLVIMAIGMLAYLASPRYPLWYLDWPRPWSQCDVVGETLEAVGFDLLCCGIMCTALGIAVYLDERSERNGSDECTCAPWFTVNAALFFLAVSLLALCCYFCFFAAGLG